MGYFKDPEKNIIREELLDKEAFEYADKFVKEELNSTQLRRFFGEFRQLEKKIKSKSFEEVKPLIKMVKSKASYSANPKKRKIPIIFKNFLVDNLDKIHDEKDFEAFMLYFEAVVGFCYGQGMKME